MITLTLKEYSKFIINLLTCHFEAVNLNFKIDQKIQ